jgi:branched-chain amino acid aminotransferase
VPIQSVDDRVVGEGKPGPITRSLQSTYAQAVRGELPQYESWLTRI